MVDYIKMYIYLEASFISHDILNFIEIQNTCKKTGNTRTLFIAEYHHLKLKYYSDTKRLTIQGSLHKFFNSLCHVTPLRTWHLDKGFNYNDFSYAQLEDCLNHLELEIGINLKESKISSIEFGLNLRHSFNTDKILDGLLLLHGNTFDKDSWYRVAKMSQYEFKIYDKGMQNRLNFPLIRIEKKYKKMGKLKPYGLYKASDLLCNPTLYNNIVMEILEDFYKKLIFSDYTIDKSKLTPRQVSKLKDYSNDIYWKSLESTARDTPKKELRQLNELYSENIHEKLTVQFLEKWNELLYKI